MKKISTIFIALATIAAAVMPLSRSGRHLGRFSFVEHQTEPLLAEGEYDISPYDNIFRRVARRHNMDWRLLAAIASCESRFDAAACSERGALGLMQVMPHIARHFDVEREELLDPAINIDVACKIYRSTRRQLNLYRSQVAEIDIIAFTIAAYNCGASRIIDAQNLAEYYDDNKYEWAVVADYLQLLGDEEFYNHEAVVGDQFAQGHITVAYTNRVLERYARYKREVGIEK